MHSGERFAPINPSETYNTAPDQLYATIGDIIQSLGYSTECMELCIVDGKPWILVDGRIKLHFDEENKTITACAGNGKPKPIKSYDKLQKLLSRLGKKGYRPV